MSAKLPNSRFVTFEGIEGSGKTTQIQMLSNHLEERGIDHLLTREPGGTPIGDQIRGMVLNPDNTAMTPTCELLLYAAARAQHIEQVIRPALLAGRLVLCDRFKDATMAYQGFGQGVDLETIRDLNALATGGLLPDLTLVLDLEPAAGMSRIGGRPLDAFERMDLAFHRRVREGYLEIARTEKRRVVVLRADQDEDTLAAAVAATVDDLLGRRELPRAV